MRITWTLPLLLLLVGTIGPDRGYAQNLDPDEPEFAPESGGFGFFTGYGFGLSNLETVNLDPELDERVMTDNYRIMVILSNWVLGGNWASGSIGDPPAIYDEFTFDWGGFFTGYDYQIGDLSLRAAVTVGDGDLKMIRNRPDFTDDPEISPEAHPILEVYRRDEFFAVEPEFSVGYHLLSIIDVRLGASYLVPVGRDRVSDLEHLSYGVQFLFGFRSGGLF